MMSARKGILNAHYLIVCKTLQQCVFKEKYAGEEFHQSMCPFYLLSLICRCNKHHSVVPMLLSQNPSLSLQRGAEKEDEDLRHERGRHARCNNIAGRCDESTTISADPKQHASSRAKLFNVLQRDGGAT